MHPGLWIIIGVNMAISLVAFFYCLLTGNWLLLRPFARWRYTKEDSNHPFSSFIKHDMFIRLKFFVFINFLITVFILLVAGVALVGGVLSNG